MMDLVGLFSSAPRIRILGVLHQARGALPLRQISYLCRLPLFSVQRALQRLHEEKIIRRKVKKPYVLFELNEYHPAYRFLTEVFRLEERHRLAARVNSYHRKARAILDFSSSAADFFRQVKNRDLWT